MKKSTFAILVTITLFAFVSCKNMINPKTNKQNTLSNSDYVEIICKAQNSSIPETTDSKSRNAMPDFSGLAYKLTATADNEEPIEKSNNSPTFSLKLKKNKEWTIKVDAVVSTTPSIVVFSGSTKITPTNATGSITIQLERNTKATDNGHIELSVQKDSSVGELTVKYSYSDGKGHQGNNNNNPQTLDSAAPWTIQINDLQPGDYSFALQFYDNSDILVYDLRTTANVLPGLTTNRWVLEKGAIDSDEFFTITQELLDDFAASVFYVKGTGNTSLPNNGLAANDDNLGGAYTPLETINKAVEKCTSTTKEYTIFIDGEVEVQYSITINNSKKINFRSFSTTEKATIKRSASLINSLMKINGYSNCTFENILFEGNGTASTCTTNGGCIFATGTLTLTNCTFKNFYTEAEYAGAIYAQGNFTATNCNFEQNTISHNPTSGNGSGNGGAIYLATEQNATYTQTLKNCTFTNNRAQTNETSGNYNGGGALYIFLGPDTSTTSTINVENTLFDGNSSSLHGGAIAIYGKKANTVTITDAIIKNSTTGKQGGAIYNYLLNGTPVLENCKIVNNKVNSNNYAYGGGIWLYGKLNATNCIFSGNEAVTVDLNAETNGGAIYTGNGMNCNFKDCHFGKGTIDGVTYDLPNKAKTGAVFGCMQNSSDSNTITFENCTIGNFDKASDNFESNQTQVTLGQCATEENAGNVGDSIIYCRDKFVFSKGTKICYNYANESIINIKQAYSLSIGSADDGSDFVEVYGNTISNTSNNDFVSIINCTSASDVYVYGKIHHNYVNNHGGVFYGACYLRMMSANAEICYNNQADRDKSGDDLYGSIVIRYQILLNGGKIVGNHSTEAGKEVYEIYFKGSNFEITGSEPIQIGVEGEPNKYNGIYLAEKEGTLTTVKISSDVNLHEGTPLIQLDIPEDKYQSGTIVLTGDKVASNYGKFKLFPKEEEFWGINSEGKLEQNLVSTSDDLFKGFEDDAITELTLNPSEDFTITPPESYKEGGSVYKQAIIVPAGKKLTIKGTPENPIKISPPNCQKMISVSGELILENVIIDGSSFTTQISNGLIDIQKDGKLYMNSGATIKNITYNSGLLGPICLKYENSYFEMNEGSLIQASHSQYQGAVSIENSTAKFVMNGGIIENNIIPLSSSVGGTSAGVNVVEGTFEMNGGEIKNNTAYTASDKSYGGGVYVKSGATFIMSDGTITGNTTYTGHGDDLYVESGATFTMTGGTIETAVISNSATYTHENGQGTITNESRAD